MKNPDKIPRPESAPGTTAEPAPVPTVFATPKPTKEQTKKSSFNLHKHFVNENVNYAKDVNTEILNEHFKYKTPLFLIKDLYKTNQAKNEQAVNLVSDALIDLRNVGNKKEIPENENPDNVINFFERILDFKKQQKGKEEHINTQANASKITNSSCTSKSR